MRKALVAILLLCLSSPVFAADAPKESVYERVIRMQTLRCGYIPYSYFFRVDPNTKAMSGVQYDIMGEIGRLMNIKIEWAEELTWATVATSLQTGRVDAFCSGMWIDTQNGKFLAFTQPLFYNAISVYGRADENRIKAIGDLNNPAIRVVSRDGGTSEIVARQDFPKATVISLPSSISDGEQLEQITTKKADVIFYGDDSMMEAMKANPGKFKDLLPGVKLRTYATAIALPINDPALKNMFDNAVTELRGSKFIDRTLQKYAPAGSWQNTMQ
jgi:ABC-type amino acid transport substrate-binding protein